MPKEKFPVGVIVHMHQKGWMDTDGMLIWLQMYDDMLTTEQMIQMLEEEDSDEEFLGFD